MWIQQCEVEGGQQISRFHILWQAFVLGKESLRSERWDDLRCPPYRLGWRIGLQNSIPSPLSPLNAHFELVVISPSRTLLRPQKSRIHWVYTQIWRTNNNASIDCCLQVRNHSMNCTKKAVDRDPVYQRSFGSHVQSDSNASLATCSQKRIIGQAKSEARECNLYLRFRWWPQKLDFLCAFWRSQTLVLKVSRILARAACCPVWLSVRKLKTPKWSERLDLSNACTLLLSSSRNFSWNLALYLYGNCIIQEEIGQISFGN